MTDMLNNTQGMRCMPHTETISMGPQLSRESIAFAKRGFVGSNPSGSTIFLSSPINWRCRRCPSGEFRGSSARTVTVCASRKELSSI